MIIDSTTKRPIPVASNLAEVLETVKKSKHSAAM